MNLTFTIVNQVGVTGLNVDRVNDCIPRRRTSTLAESLLPGRRGARGPIVDATLVRVGWAKDSLLSTVRYLGIEVDDALEISEQVEI